MSRNRLRVGLWGTYFVFIEGHAGRGRLRCSTRGHGPKNVENHCTTQYCRM